MQEGGNDDDLDLYIGNDKMFREASNRDQLMGIPFFCDLLHFRNIRGSYLSPETVK